ncbi:MAG: gamma-glutamylcyclotransferase family protein [Hyphomicrobiaceae bacterium]
MKMTKYLFVYGTLMSRAKGELGTDQRRRLAAESHLLGEARINGRLFNLGNYPALGLEKTRSPFAYGELLDLHDPTATFAWLDTYEGLDPTNLAQNEYRRVVHSVELLSSGSTKAWVYALNVRVDEQQLIESGRWLAATCETTRRNL